MSSQRLLVENRYPAIWILFPASTPGASRHRSDWTLKVNITCPDWLSESGLRRCQMETRPAFATLFDFSEGHDDVKACLTCFWWVVLAGDKLNSRDPEVIRGCGRMASVASC